MECKSAIEMVNSKQIFCKMMNITGRECVELLLLNDLKDFSSTGISAQETQID